MAGWRARPGPRRFGLRGRLVVALVATSVATLLAATLTVLPPLKRRLETERLSDLRGLLLTAKPTLRAIPPTELRRDSPELRRIVTRLQRRAGGRIVVLDQAGRTLADTATPTARGPAIGSLADERAKALRHPSGVVSGEQGPLAFALSVVRDGRERITLVLVKRLDDTRAAVHVVRTALPLEFGVGIAVALLLALLLSRSLLGRLGRLQTDAAALSTDGLRHPVTVTSGDEVGDVARALEDMRLRLVEEEASRQAFIATASHELRTPLASLQVTLELLQEQVSRGAADPRVTAASAETALRQTHRLVALATELLDLSRVDGDVPLRLEPIDVQELAELVGHEFAGRLDSEGRALHVDGDAAVAVAVADPTALARIFRVLLDNACSYGDGTITVHATADGDRVRVSVADEGPGLAPDERERVFTRFTRGRAAGSAPGAGLGLSIARGLAVAMGGALRAGTVQRGARFDVTLPRWEP